MRVLEFVDVLGDARILGPPAEGGGKKGDDVRGLEAAAADLEVIEEIAEWDLVVICGVLFEREEPGFLDDRDGPLGASRWRWPPATCC